MKLVGQHCFSNRAKFEVKKIVISAIAIMLATPTHAVNLGVGSHQCSEIMEGAMRSEAVQAAATSWVQGYITYSIASTKPEIRALFRTPEPNEIVAFIADYCRKNPKDPLAGAAVTFEAKMMNDALERLGDVADQAARKYGGR